MDYKPDDSEFLAEAGRAAIQQVLEILRPLKKRNADVTLSPFHSDNLALEQIRRHFDVVYKAQEQELGKALDLFLRGGNYAPQMKKMMKDGGGDLTLLDNTELDELLVLHRMSGRLREKHAKELNAILFRLKDQRHVGSHDPSGHPVEPAILCRSFARALDVLELDMPGWMAVFDRFERMIGDDLSPVLQQFDERVEQRGHALGIVTDLNKRPTRTPEYARPTSSARATGATGHATASPHATSVAGISGPAAAGPAGSGAAAAGAAGSGSAGSGSAESGPSAHGPAAYGPAASASAQSGLNPGTATETVIPQDVDAVGSRIDVGELLGLLQRSARPSAEGSTSYSESPGRRATDRGQEVSTDDVLTALDRLQHETAAPGAETHAADQDETSIKDRVVRNLSGANAGESQTLSDVSDSLIDVVSLFFDYVLKDPAIPEAIKGLIARLQIPVIKIALIDRSFFSSAAHPARQLIGNIAEQSVGLDELETEDCDRLLAEIRRTVERVNDEFDRDIEGIETAREEFQERIAHVREITDAREREAVENLVQLDNREAAASLARECMQEVVAGKPDLPDPVHRMLLESWTELMTMIHLEHGTDSREWHDARHVASMLVWSLLPKPESAQRAELARRLPELLRSLRAGLSRVEVDDTTRDEVIAALAREHERHFRNVGSRGPSTSSAATDKGRIERAVGERTVGERTLDADSVREDRSEVAAPATAAAEGHADSGAKGFVNRQAEQVERILENERTRREEVTSAHADLESGDRYLTMARQLPTDQWLELDQGDHGSVHVKLGWRGQISGDYMFINRNGQRVISVEEAEVAEMLRMSRLRWLNESRVADRAIDAMVADLRRESGATSEVDAL